MKLTVKQTIALDYLEDDITNEVLFGGGAGGGKTALGCYFQIKRRLKYPETRGLIGRAVLKTLKETTLVSFFQVAKIQGLLAGQHYRYNGQSNQIEFFNGSVILLKDLFQYPSDPNFDELGSLEITDSFIDEANQVTDKAKNIVKSRIRFRLDDYNLIPKQLYTCNPAKNWTYSEFYKPDRDGELEPNKKFIQSLVDDNPFISKHYKQNLLTLDKESKERLLFGNWEYLSDPSSLIDYDKIINSFSNTFVSSGDKYITCDVARFGNDSTVIGVWSGYRVKIYRYSKKSIVEVAQIVRQLMAENSVPISNVLLDEDGVGGGAVDILACKGFVNNSSPLENPISRTKDNFDNLKSQCYFKLAEKINSDEIFIDCPSNFKQMIIEELEQVKQKSVDNDAKKGIIPKDKVKEKIGRSPDFSDMLAMRMWFEFKPKFVVGVW
ncbi:Phage terminase large subunit [uncultured Caudovirales phage]|uniref:Phage terminase large subunit n=1 Tax=uncultured Caudovirales phage TaxID=2100421 RepID=A0A6J7WK88_9CAUD|nr:Phage terminase large subunit [uncultured Caudovirales phage]